MMQATPRKASLPAVADMGQNDTQYQLFLQQQQLYQAQKLQQLQQQQQELLAQMQTKQTPAPQKSQPPQTQAQGQASHAPPMQQSAASKKRASEPALSVCEMLLASFSESLTHCRLCNRQHSEGAQRHRALNRMLTISLLCRCCRASSLLCLMCLS